MGRKTDKTHKHCASCKNCTKQSGNGRLAPQTIIDVLEHQRTQHAGSAQCPCPGSATAEQALPNANVTMINGRPSMALPHGLGSITVPPGAQHVDVRFNCKTNQLLTGQITDNLVVHVDVLYHATVTAGDYPNVSCKTEDYPTDASNV